MKEFELILKINGITSGQLQNLEWFTADILELGDLESAFENVSEVIHCAGIVSFYKRDREELSRVNMEGTANMVNLSLAGGIQKFAYISSIAALGRGKENVNINENSKWESGSGNSFYAETKLAGEMEVWRGIQEGLNAVIVNPGIIIGACDYSRGTGKMFGLAKNAIPFFTPGINGFVDVRDVSQCVIRLLDKNIFNERFILVSENYAFQKFYDDAAECFEKSKPRFNTPFWMAVIGYKFLGALSYITGKPALLTAETTHAAYQKYFYDNSKIRNILTYEFIPVKDTIRWACEWYK